MKQYQGDTPTGALLADPGGCTRFAIEIRGRRLRRYPLAQTRAIEALQRQFGRYLWVAGVSKTDGSRRVFVRRGCREAGGVPYHSWRFALMCLHHRWKTVGAWGVILPAD